MTNSYAWTSSEFEIVDNTLWFVPSELNVLVKYDLNKEMIEEVYEWGEHITVKGASYNVKEINGKIVVIPGRDNVLRIISEDGSRRDIVVDDFDISKERYQSVAYCGSYILCFPLFSNNIIQIDSEWNLKYLPFDVKRTTGILNKNAVIYLFNRDENISWISQNTLKKGQIKNEQAKNVIAGVDCNQEVIFLLADGSVYLCDSNNMSQGREILRLREGDFFSAGAYLEDSVILFQNNSCEKICIYNLESGEYKFAETGLSRTIDWDYNAFSSPCVRNNKIWIFSVKSQELLRINSGGKIEKKYRISINDMINRIDDSKLFDDGDSNLFEENNVRNLKLFVKYVESM